MLTSINDDFDPLSGMSGSVKKNQLPFGTSLKRFGLLVIMMLAYVIN